jgi:hypothetical protein
LDLRGMKRQEGRGNCIMWSSVICTPSNIITIIKSRRMRLPGRVARMREMICVQNLGKHEGRDHSEDLSVDGRIILKQMLGKWV